MSDDFMGGMFDFNGDGKTDLGEEYIAYKIYEDCTKDVGSSSSPQFSPRTRKLSGTDIFCIVVFAYAILKAFCDWFY